MLRSSSGYVVIFLERSISHKMNTRQGIGMFWIFKFWRKRLISMCFRFTFASVTLEAQALYQEKSFNFEVLFLQPACLRSLWGANYD